MHMVVMVVYLYTIKYGMYLNISQAPHTHTNAYTHTYIHTFFLYFIMIIQTP